MFILSYDIASKSLAVSLIQFNENYKHDLSQIMQDFHKEIKSCITKTHMYTYAKNCIYRIDKLLDELIQPIYFDVVDLIPGKKMKETTVIQRTARLKAYLNMIDEKIKSIINPVNPDQTPGISDQHTVKVLLEYQMGPNDKSRNVCSQILYHYSDTNVEYKNTGNLNEEKTTDETENYIHKILHDVEIVGPSLKNKINLDPDKPYVFFTQKYVKLYDANKAHSKNNLLFWVKKMNVPHMIKGIKSKNLDDIADSVNMTLAWIYFKSKLL
jgi:hypothetical protein